MAISPILQNPTTTSTGPATSRPRTRRRAGAVLVLVAALLTTTLFAPALASAKTTKHVATRNPLVHTAGEITMIKAVRRTINRERAAHGLPRVHGNKKLRLSARRHNLDMARMNDMSHQLPGEAFFATRITRAGYRWSWAGENIAWNSRMSTAGVVQLEAMMYHEKAPNDGHRVNILSRHFRDVGVDVYVDHKHHKVWLTTDFGHH